MDTRRRTIADNIVGTNLPLPSSAFKKPNPHLAASTRETGSRYSLAPQRIQSQSKARQSSVATSSNYQFSQQSDANFHPAQAPAFSNSNPHYHDSVRRSSVHPVPQTIIRQSTHSSYFPASSRGPMSVNRNEHVHFRSSSAHDIPVTAAPNFQATPSANRASSVIPFHGSHYGSASLLPPFQALKDPRPRDKNTVAQWQSEIYDFLQETGYQHALTPKTLQTPTTKDFHNIFKHLIHCSDPYHAWGSGKKLEEEVIPLLKNMGYVCYDSISKSGLQTPGTMRVWPILLAMMHWIVTSIKLRDEAMSNDKIRLDTTIEPTPDDIQLESHVSVSHWLHYLGQTYKLFLANDDFDCDLHKPPLEEYFQKRKDRVLSEIERLEGRIAGLETEKNNLAKKPSSLEAAQEEHLNLSRDTDKFLDYVRKLKEANKKAEKQNDILKKDLEFTNAKVQEATKRKKALAAVVEKQNITDVELQQISSTRSQLERSTAAARTKHTQLSESMMDLEVRTQQASDRVEKLLTIYKSKAVKLGLIPRAPEPFENLDFSQNVNGGAADVANMLPDPTVEIKPALVQLKKNTIAHRLNLTDQVLAVEEKLANLTETLQEKRENLQILEDSVQQLTKTLEEDKEKFALELAVLNEQIEFILKRVTEVESTMENNRMVIDHEIQALRVRLGETEERISKMTQENLNEMTSIVAFILAYKDRVKENTIQLKNLSESIGSAGIGMGSSNTTAPSGNIVNMRI